MTYNEPDQQRGFTLVEVSIILSVVAILSAVMAPVIGGVLDGARLSAAKAELVAISQALGEFLEDIGCTFVPQNSGSDSGWRYAGSVEALAIAPPEAPPGASGRGRLASDAYASSSCSAPNVCTGDPVELLVSAGDVPSLGPDGDEWWVEPVEGVWVDFLEFYLISNTPGNDPDRAFPTLADCADPVSSYLSDIRAWQGAYLNVDSGDPWGNRYMINTALLTSTGGEDIVILSAGPDQEVDSLFAVDGFVPGDDDLALLFSGGQ